MIVDQRIEQLRAQGYVHAQDRFYEMDFRRHVTSGRLSELFGEGQLETDVLLRTLGWRRGAEAEGVADARGIMRSFQEGSGDFDAPRAMSTDESNSLGMSALGGDPIPMRNRRTGEIVGYRSQNGSVDYRYPQMKTRGQAAGRTQANLVGYRIDKNGNRVEIRNMHIDIE